MRTVSIIVPVYNVEAFLPKCIDSILSQTFRDFELILIDDGSPDRSGEICDQYAAADARICVSHQPNAGVSCARNNGLEIAAGKYITFCDSDDYIDPQQIETMVRLIEGEAVDSVELSFKTVDAEGNVLYQGQHWEGLSVFTCSDDRLQYLFEKILCKKVGWEVTTRLFRREIIERHHIRFCETCRNFAEDLGFVGQYALCSQGEISVNLCTYSYLQRSGSMMNASTKTVKLDQVNEVSKSIYQVYAEHFFRAKDLRFFTVLHALILYNQLSKILKNPLLAAPSFLEVKDSAWMKRHLRGVFRFRRSLTKHRGKQDAWRIILLTRYARHQNYTRYRLERFLIDRLIISLD